MESERIKVQKRRWKGEIPKDWKQVKRGNLKRGDIIEFGYEIGGSISKMFIRAYRRPEPRKRKPGINLRGKRIL